MQIIKREKYLSQIRPFIGSGLIKVLTGQRRVGKSYILQAIQQEIKERGDACNIIHINLEDFAFAHIKDAASLHGEISAKLADNVKNYIFIDEIQEIEDFDKVIRSLNLNSNNDIYVTGSNSAMLSSEIASRLAGRSIEFNIHPLSYEEFLVFHEREDSDEALESYLRYGGMPYLRNLPDTDTWNEYLSGVCDAMVYRDIVSRHSLRNNDFLQRLLNYIAGNIGQLFSAKNIADYLKSQRSNVSVSSVQTYVDCIAQAYVIRRVSRWDVTGKKHFEIGEKMYFEDLGVRNCIVGYRPGDIGGILENAVYNKLLIDGYKVHVGVLPKGKEVDFVVEKNGELKYIQVAVSVAEQSTAEREFGNLESIPDNYEKIVVTLRDSAPNTASGIKLMSLRQFLLS